jgi:hypothetical protein
LETGVAAAVVRGVEAGFGGLLLHGFGGFFEGDLGANPEDDDVQQETKLDSKEFTRSADLTFVYALHK